MTPSSPTATRSVSSTRSRSPQGQDGGRLGGPALSPASHVASLPRGGIVLGLDPGVLDIATVSAGADSHLSPRGFSQKQWRAETGAEARLAMTRRWCADLSKEGGAWERLRAVTPKTASITEFIDYLKVKVTVRPEIMTEKLKRKWADARFTAWSLGKRTLARAASSFLAGSLEDGSYGVPKLIAYGNAKWGGIRGRKAGPTTATREAFFVAARSFRGGRHRIVDVDEWRTTLTHSSCGHHLQQVYAPPTKAQVKRHADKAARPVPDGWQRPPPRPLPAMVLHARVQHCCNPLCTTPGERFVHRDGDASICIRMLGEALVAGEPRPAAMTRGAVAMKPAVRSFLMPMMAGGWVFG